MSLHPWFAPVDDLDIAVLASAAKQSRQRRVFQPRAALGRFAALAMTVGRLNRSGQPETV
jgi:hypothetical protein